MPVVQRKNHILVLGASGRIGRMLRRWWAIAPPAGLVPHWQFREAPAEGGLVWRPGEAPPATLPRCDGLLALWGVTPGPGRDLGANGALALAAMELAATIGARRVLHCSSAAVYPPGPAPLTEDMAGPAPNPYGHAKLDMEEAIAGWRAAHPGGPEACALRIGNVAGADSLFAALAKGDPVTLDRFTDGHGPARSYISVPALARIVEALFAHEGPLPATLNIASPAPVAMEAIARAAGRDVLWRDAPEAAAPMVWLDTVRLAAIAPLPPESAAGLVASWRQLRGAA